MDCCPTFTAARQSGTDNEAYGPLLHPNINADVEPDAPLVMGASLPPFLFCPWCGKKVQRLPKKADV